MSRRAVVIEKIVQGPDGKGVRWIAPFESLPDWAKDVVRPRWDHPVGCECGDCWIEHEGRR